MTGYRVFDDGTDRATWLEARRSGVAATDAATIATGGSKAWANLRHEKETGDSGFYGNAYTRYGHDREAVIAAWAEEQFGLHASTALLTTAGPAASDAPYGLDLATPDALAAQVPLRGRDGEFNGAWSVDTIGEFKTTVHDWPTWADTPAKYRWQVAWQLHVTGATRCMFMFEPHENFVPLYMEPRVFVIERADMEVQIGELVERVEAWRTADLDPVPEDLLPLDGLLTARALAKETASAAADRVAEYDAQIRALLTAHGPLAEPFEGSAANVSWTGKPVKTARFDSTAFKKADPDTYQKFTKTTEAQPRLTITARS